MVTDKKISSNGQEDQQSISTIVKKYSAPAAQSNLPTRRVQKWDILNASRDGQYQSKPCKQWNVLCCLHTFLDSSLSNSKNLSPAVPRTPALAPFPRKTETAKPRTPVLDCPAPGGFQNAVMESATIPALLMGLILPSPCPVLPTPTPNCFTIGRCCWPASFYICT